MKEREITAVFERRLGQTSYRLRQLGNVVELQIPSAKAGVPQEIHVGHLVSQKDVESVLREYPTANIKVVSI